MKRYIILLILVMFFLSCKKEAKTYGWTSSEKMGNPNWYVTKLMCVPGVDGSPAAGVFILYSKKYKKRPKFSYRLPEKKELYYYINNKKVHLTDKFILYVNDSNGNPFSMELSTNIAYKIFGYQTKSGDLMTLWEKHIKPQLDKNQVLK